MTHSPWIANFPSGHRASRRELGRGQGVEAQAVSATVSARLVGPPRRNVLGECAPEGRLLWRRQRRLERVRQANDFLGSVRNGVATPRGGAADARIRRVGSTRHTCAQDRQRDDTEKGPHGSIVIHRIQESERPLFVQ